MNPFTIRISRAKQRFGKRKRAQWRWELIAWNGEAIDPRDTYANPGDIRDIWAEIVYSNVPVILETHYSDGNVLREKLR